MHSVKENISKLIFKIGENLRIPFQMFTTPHSFEKHYQAFWDTPFPEGPQKIYLLSLDITDAYDFDSAFSTYPVSKKKFSCFQELAQYFFSHPFEKFRLCCEINCSFEDEDEENEYRNKVEGAQTPLEFFTVIVNEAQETLSPVLFVPKHNFLLQFLMNHL